MFHSATPRVPIQFPIRSFRFGLAAMIVLLGASVILNWRVGEQIRVATHAQIKIVVAAEKVEQYGSVLEMAVKAVVANGDPEAAARYRSVQPELRTILSSLRLALEQSGGTSEIGDVDNADLALIAMEYQALDLASRGELAAARRLIHSAGYDELVQIYYRGIHKVEQRSASYAHHLQRQLDLYLWALLLLSAASLVVVVLGWFAFIRPVRRWGGELEQARAEAELSALQLRDKQGELETLNEQLFKQARIDPLTGLATRLGFNEDTEALRHSSDPAPNLHCAVMCDIDCFKQYNDSCGHIGGDRALRLVADALKAAVRSGDRVYRLGGEEFLVLTQAASARAAMVHADRLRKAVADLQLAHPTSPMGIVTISMGVAALERPRMSIERWLREADDALYAAKNAGRNRVSDNSETRPAAAQAI